MEFHDLIMQIFGDYGSLVLAIMGVCAAIATLLPAPDEGASTVYRGLYAVCNWIGMNFGKAKNADEVERE